MTFAAISGGAILGLLAAVLLVGVFFCSWALCRMAALGDRALGARLEDTPVSTRTDRLPYDVERNGPVEAPLPLRWRSPERLRALPRPPRSPARQARRR